MAAPSRNPSTWDEYQYGTSPSASVRSDSAQRSVRFEGGEEEPLLDAECGRQDDVEGGHLRHRRSSMTMRLSNLAQVGGVNSIENFARSWSRAAGFYEVAPNRPSLLFDANGESSVFEPESYDRIEPPRQRIPQEGLLRVQFASQNAPESSEDDASVLEIDATKGKDRAGRGTIGRTAEQGTKQNMDARTFGAPETAQEGESIFAIAPHLATPLGGSYGTSYGTLQSTLNRSSMVHAGQLWREQQETGSSKPDGEREPLLVKEVEQDGKKVLMVAGQSTLPQTVFNSTNVLIGVGILSLPLGIKYAGWVCGMGFLLMASVMTWYTARILAKCMDTDRSLVTFADLAFISYGQKARILTSILFTLELLAACVALVILFSDTLDILIPGVGSTEWKIFCGLLLIPLNFAPLRFLSFTSVLGIFSCFCIVLIVFIDGFIKPHAPGSLREPMPTYLFPANWLTLPLSFGLLMSPWGGHGVFPNIYRDMRHPHKFPKGIKITFIFTYILDALTAMAGMLMFGDLVLGEITSNIIREGGYPEGLSIIMSIFIAIIPLTKLPLNARPIISTLEIFAGLDARSMSDSPVLIGMSGLARGCLKMFVRIVVAAVVVGIAVLFPEFERIGAFMGSCLCFTICVILPLCFYLKIFGKEISRRERLLDYVLIAISSVMAVTGTVFAFLPRELIGAS